MYNNKTDGKIRGNKFRVLQTDVELSIDILAPGRSLILHAVSAKFAQWLSPRLARYAVGLFRGAWLSDTTVSPDIPTTRRVQEIQAGVR